ncbi:zinc finger protein [Oryctes borbonicus]|uniref:RING-type E3 ubiquitin transferase n=1 Tax=Oryctes borbonicus TaxID=1629725 RepID=A0A0T6AVK4_9SCAR|nr:zinc finger protein [Oryctes borbonicus]
MQVYPAGVTNIIQSIQRDDLFIEELQEYLTTTAKCLGQKNYNRLRKYLPHLTSAWYYSLTSLSNLLTLGEEYAGIIRFGSDNSIPSKYLHLLWLVLYVGGEPLFERITKKLEEHISNSTEIRNEAKSEITRILRFFRTNKDLFVRFHYSLFYIQGKYHSISNRISGIKYVLLRQWMQDNAATSSIKFLGYISLIYVMYSLIKNYIYQESTKENIVYSSELSKVCVLCVERRTNTCATLCGHLFCWHCIHDSLKYQQSCPVCREPVNPSRIVFLQNYT